ATASTASTGNTTAGSESVAAKKPSTRNPQITAPAQPYGQRGGLTGSSGAPGRFRACSCTTSASLSAPQNHHSPASITSKPATTSNGKRGEFARYQQATPAHSIMALLNRNRKVPSTCMRILSASSANCCVIPIASPAAQASRSQKTSPAQRDVIAARSASTDHARERSSRDTCDPPPRCWVGPYPFLASHLNKRFGAPRRLPAPQADRVAVGVSQHTHPRLGCDLPRALRSVAPAASKVARVASRSST